jgi:transcriptional regulator with XRE-family HTH domain
MNSFPYSPRIKVLREQRAWSQEQLAEISGVSGRTVQRIENGQPASLETLKAIAAAFDLDVHDLTKPNLKGSRGAEVSFLVKMSTGNELLSIVGGADAFQFDNDELQGQDDVDLIGYFLQELKDTGDLWGDMEPIDHVREVYRFSEQIRELEEAGFLVFALRYPQQFVFGENKTTLNVAYVFVARRDNPKIVGIQQNSSIPTTTRAT